MKDFVAVRVDTGELFDADTLEELRDKIADDNKWRAGAKMKEGPVVYAVKEEIDAAVEIYETLQYINKGE